MEQIEELHGRIKAALEHIGGGVVALEEKHANQPVPTLEDLDMAKHAELLADLDDEKMANSQLRERLKLLRARLDEWKVKVSAVDNAEELIAMQSELDMLRSEAAKAVEAEALRLEVTRLKAELEVAQNTAAVKVEALEEELAEEKAQSGQMRAQLETLTAQLAEAQSAVAVEPDATSDAAGETPVVDVSAFEYEINALKAEVETLRAETSVAAAVSDDPSDVVADAEEVDALAARLAALDEELQTLRASNDKLRQSNNALRDANAAGVGDPELINNGLLAEVEGLRAARATDQAEVNAVLARLGPLLATAPNLPEGEDA